MTENKNQTRKILTDHVKSYPDLQIQDIFKLLFQSAFGCEHLVSDTDGAIAYIENEYKTIPQEQREIEPLDGGYCRVPLSYINKGLTACTLGKIFVLSAKREENARIELESKLKTAMELVCEGVLPFDANEFDTAVNEWKALGYPPVRHSDIFREKYKPSYRVIANEFIPFLPLFAEIDKLGKRGVVAIDGGSASGKTTLAELLEKLYDCTVFHTDDYFLPPQKRTPERYEEIGGNVDYERLLAEILEPISLGRSVIMQKFDCRTMSLGEKITVIPRSLVIVEGAYSMHPTLAKYYGLSTFLDITPECQKKRIGRRNSPEMARRFENEWIPLENIYFEGSDIKSRCNIVIGIS